MTFIFTKSNILNQCPYFYSGGALGTFHNTVEEPSWNFWNEEYLHNLSPSGAKCLLVGGFTRMLWTCSNWKLLRDNSVFSVIVLQQLGRRGCTLVLVLHPSFLALVFLLVLVIWSQLKGRFAALDLDVCLCLLDSKILILQLLFLKAQPC